MKEGQLVWLHAQWVSWWDSTTGRSETICPGNCLMRHLSQRWTACLGTCSIILPDNTPISGEVRQFPRVSAWRDASGDTGQYSWALAQWISLTRHYSQLHEWGNPDDLSRLLLNVSTVRSSLWGEARKCIWQSYPSQPFSELCLQVHRLLWWYRLVGP